MIKIKNNRNKGCLFHYAHFLCDCLFPEISSNIFRFKKVIRKKNIRQTIGNFSNFYTEVMTTENIELPEKQFNQLKIHMITYKKKEEYCNKKYFDKFRQFIFLRYKINNLEYNSNYPEVLLIKRNERVELLNDKCLQKLNNNISTGKERREIHNIDIVDIYLKEKYNDKYKSVYFENIPFKEQVLYFNNAKMIICAHGAVMSNMFFCKEKTKIIEVTCNTNWPFFDKISSILILNHIKCINNNCYKVIECIENNTI